MANARARLAEAGGLASIECKRGASIAPMQFVFKSSN